MKKLVYDIINRLDIPEISFSDVRLTSTDSKFVYFENGVLKRMGSGFDSNSLGIRVLINGCWGFAGTNDFSKFAIDKAIKKAISNARYGSKFKKKKVTFYPISPVSVSYRFKPEEDPFLMDDQDIIDYWEKIAKSLQGEQIVFSYTSCRLYRQYKVYANSEGTIADTLVYDTLPSMEVYASDGKQVLNRNFPGHMAAKRGGFEVVRNYNFPEEAEVIVKEAQELLKAPTIEEERADIIIGSGHLALQIHESIGHAVEADRIFGMEISYAGKTFVKPEMLGKFPYGSDIVNIYSDSTDTTGLGFHPVDDEGVPGKRTDIIKNGILVDQLTSREVAHVLGLSPSSNMKASYADDFPLVRMSNLCMSPGKGSIQELIEDTENGYLIDYTKTWSIDDNRNNFQFTTEIGWKIKDGRVVSIVREPTYYGITKEFWNSCDWICGPEEWQMHGTFNCGKGEPGQAMHLSHGVAPARFRNIVCNVKA